MKRRDPLPPLAAVAINGWLWFIGAIRRRVCRHEFRTEDLELTGIPRPPDPRRGATQAELDRWGDEVIGGKHPWFTERVSWPCAKCHTEFRAHCGLDILAGRGVPKKNA